MKSAGNACVTLRNILILNISMLVRLKNISKESHNIFEQQLVISSEDENKYIKRKTNVFTLCLYNLVISMTSTAMATGRRGNRPE